MELIPGADSRSCGGFKRFDESQRIKTEVTHALWTGFLLLRPAYMPLLLYNRTQIFQKHARPATILQFCTVNSCWKLEKSLKTEM